LKTNSSPAGQEIVCVLWNLNFHYRVHNSPLHVFIPSQMNPVHAIPS